jgi:UDP-2,3-diacylglucosamine hydrolase
VYFFQGNHDVWTYSYFEELGMIRLTQPAVVEIAGKKFCLGHGDGLGPVPRGYRFLRSLFHNRIVQAMFSMLHPWLAFRFGTGWSKENRLARKEEYVFKGEDEPLYKFAADFAKIHEVDHFIFGHYHVAVSMTLPSGASFNILKDWIDASPYICFDGENLTSESL